MGGRRSCGAATTAKPLPGTFSASTSGWEPNAGTEALASSLPLIPLRSLLTGRAHAPELTVEEPSIRAWRLGIGDVEAKILEPFENLVVAVAVGKARRELVTQVVIRVL